MSQLLKDMPTELANSARETIEEEGNDLLFYYEEKFAPENVCGVDEVGRAPLAGPVTAACAYIPLDVRGHEIWHHVRDSKKVSRKKREYIATILKEVCLYGIGWVDPREIETLNIHHASLLAMRRAYEDMCGKIHAEPKAAQKNAPKVVLVDGKFIPDFGDAALRIFPMIKGDLKCKSIAAASIIAKVARDNYMSKLHESFPEYGWDRNAGYPTPAHKEALRRHGITVHHRKSFAGVR